MAIASMHKMLLVGNNAERKKLIKKLHKLGCVEVVACENKNQLQYFADEKSKDFFIQKIAEIEFLFAVLKQNKTQGLLLAKKKELAYEPLKVDVPFANRPYVSFDEFNNANQYASEIDAVVVGLKQLVDEQVELKTKLTTQQNIINQTLAYKGLDKAVNEYKSTKNAKVAVGSIAKSKNEKIPHLNTLGAEYQVFESDESSQNAIVVLAHNEQWDSVQEYLSQLEFSICPFSSDIKPYDIISGARQNIQNIQTRQKDIILDIAKYEKDIHTARLLYDYYVLEQKKLECESWTATTQSCYFLEAWIPTINKDNVDNALERSDLTLAYTIREPLESETPPTLAINNGIVAPYESVTNMFSSPAYREIDPNKFVAFFFFVFFGLMLSDAGYGLILTIATGLILIKNKPPKGQANLIKLMFMGGISTVFWGILFGSYFGFSAGDMGIWYWFSPIEDPMMMLVLSLAMGIFQMCFGLGVNMVALIQKKRPLEGIFGAFSWYFIILGLGLVYLSSKIAPWVKTLGWVVLGLGMLMLMIAGTFGKKGMGKATGAFANVYNIINFFSDLMSYTRIFGLGLATGVIGMVFNQIAFVIKDLLPIKVLGWVGALVILGIGHIFNLGINALGAYVHNSRLQFVEFFGKFYTGGGQLMRPLGSEMKYYLIKPEEVKD